MNTDFPKKFSCSERGKEGVREYPEYPVRVLCGYSLESATHTIGVDALKMITGQMDGPMDGPTDCQYIYWLQSRKHS